MKAYVVEQATFLPLRLRGFQITAIMDFLFASVLPLLGKPAVVPKTVHDPVLVATPVTSHQTQFQ
jgi:hypothetical protein